jgi:hypothetical protein
MKNPQTLTYNRDGRPERSEESARPITDFLMQFKRIEIQFSILNESFFQKH